MQTSWVRRQAASSAKKQTDSLPADCNIAMSERRLRQCRGPYTKRRHLLLQMPSFCIMLPQCQRGPTGPAQKKDTTKSCLSFFGAGNEIRTRYLHLGKVALCQMSYARKPADSSEPAKRIIPEKDGRCQAHSSPFSAAPPGPGEGCGVSSAGGVSSGVVVSGAPGSGCPTSCQ